MAPIDDRYTATFIAPVEINSEGFYHLAGSPKFWIEDAKKKFTTIHPNGRSTGHRVQLDPQQWNKFINEGANIDSLREFHSKRDAT